MAHTTYAKAVISQKLEDRFLTTQIIEPDEEKKQMGTLFALVEITRPWYPNAQIGQTIINTLKREYYQQKSTSDLENFEQALKKVNEQLARITETGETDWIGHLNAVVCLKVSNQLHVTSTGAARGYLLRKQALSEITEATVRTEEAHPRATFSSIVSGEIEGSDVLFVASPALFEQFDKGALKELLAEPSAYQGVLNLVKRLPGALKRQVNFLVISEAAAPTDDPVVVYLDETSGAAATAVADFIKKTLMPALAIGGEAAQKGAKTFGHFLKTTVLPHSQRLGKQALEHTKKGAATLRQKGAPWLASTMARAKTTLQQAAPKKDAPSLIGKNLFTVHDYQTPPKKQAASLPFKARLPQLPRLPGVGVKSYTTWQVTVRAFSVSLLNRFKRFVTDARKGRNRFALLVVGVIILTVLLIGSIAAQKSRSLTRRTFQDQKEKLSEAKRLAEEGKTALIFGQQAHAVELFAKAIEDARFAATNKKLEQEAHVVLDDTASQLDKLTATTRLKGLKAVAESVTMRGITELDSKIWGFGADGALTTINLLEGTPEPTVPAPASVQVTATTSVDQKLYGATAQHNLLVASLKNKTNKVLAGSDGAQLKDAAAIQIFGGNLYGLDPAGNQIWRYQLKDDGFGAPGAFFKKKQDLGSAADMAIDGAIYVLKKNGGVDKYVKGDKQDFKLAAAPKPDEGIAAAARIFADTESLSLFILDNIKGRPRLLEYSKDGKYLHQYAFELPSIDQIYLTNRGRKAWVISGGKLYEVNL